MLKPWVWFSRRAGQGPGRVTDRAFDDNPTVVYLQPHYCDSCGEPRGEAHVCTSGPYSPTWKGGLQSFYYCCYCGRLRLYLELPCKGCKAP